MRITTLIENHPDQNRPELKAEHGVSFYIEVGDHVYMSDVGQSGNFAENSVKLDVDLSQVEALAISHYHYDHGGGLGRFFQENKKAAVFLRRSVEAEYLAVDDPESIRYIGLDRGLLNQHMDRIIYVDNNQEVAPGFHMLTDIPGKYSKPHGDERLKMRFEGETKPDTFTHEMVTIVEDKEGIVVLTGCAHNGVLNMITAAQNAFLGKPIQAVIGGFHLNREDDETVCEIGKKLLELNIPKIVTGHCTGDHATEVLAEVLGDHFQVLYSGLVMTF